MKSEIQPLQVNPNPLTTVALPPVITVERWAEIQGVDVKTVRSQLCDGRLPVAYIDSGLTPSGAVKKRRTKYVNVAKIAEMAEQQ
jgi:hypothetical protein